MKKYTVIGHPIAHSLSPMIHEAFAKATDINLEYTRTLLPENTSKDDFRAFLDDFAEQGGLGANVTAPFKPVAFEAVDMLTDAAKEVQAVNTLIYREGQWIGDSTDKIGLQEDWQRLGWDLKDKRVLILGAGGVTRSLIYAALDENPSCVQLWNRTPSKAEALLQTVDSPILSLYAPSSLSFDVVLSGLARDAVPPSDFQVKNGEWLAYDLNYAVTGVTPFVEWARKEGALRSTDGLGMLWAQAATSFLRWHGVKPNWREIQNAQAMRYRP